jgi:hypothetical protein
MLFFGHLINQCLLFNQDIINRYFFSARLTVHKFCLLPKQKGIMQM